MSCHQSVILYIQEKSIHPNGRVVQRHSTRLIPRPHPLVQHHSTIVWRLVNGMQNKKPLTFHRNGQKYHSTHETLLYVTWLSNFVWKECTGWKMVLDGKLLWVAIMAGEGTALSILSHSSCGLTLTSEICDFLSWLACRRLGVKSSTHRCTGSIAGSTSFLTHLFQHLFCLAYFERKEPSSNWPITFSNKRWLAIKDLHTPTYC